MASSFTGSQELLDHLNSVLPQSDRESLRSTVIPSLLGAISSIAVTLRNSQKVALAGSANHFGDDQLNVDVSAENHIRQALLECPSVVTASSEEDPVEKSISHAQTDSKTSEKYTVAFDPLDGSSIIAPNWSVGAIFGIWDGESALGQAPKQKQIAAILGVFGPRTTAYIALRLPGSNSVLFEIGLTDQPALQWDIVRKSVALSPAPYKTKYFAPANLRSASDSPPYMKLISQYISEKYTLRYCGGLVPDLVHALVQGHGVYISPTTLTNKAKLRRLYELCPVALIIECAGGKALDPSNGASILEKPLANTNERGGLLCGNSDEVEKAQKMLSDNVMEFSGFFKHADW